MTWNYPAELDAVIAAPHSHEILLENEEVRVLKVIIPPGKKEPFHTHRWKSVMFVTSPARIRYYDETKEVAWETPTEKPLEPKGPEWMEPEGLHAVENIDQVDYVGLRIELKRG